MNEGQLKDCLKRAVNQAPINLLETIKQQPYEKMAAHDEITRQSDEKAFTLRSNRLKPALALLSAAAVFLFAFINWQMNTRWVDSMVYLDVNPSLQIETNRRDQVIRLSGLDEVSNALIADLDYKGKDLEVVAAELLDRLVLGDYVSSSEPAILLSVYNEDPEKRDRQLSELDQAIHAYLQSLEIQPIVLTQPLDPTQTLTDYAEANQISVSKMTLIRNMILLDPELKAEDLAKLTLEQLIQVSSKVKLDLDKIIQSSDMDRIKSGDDFDDDLDEEDEIENNIDDESDDHKDDLYEHDDDDSDFDENSANDTDKDPDEDSEVDDDPVDDDKFDTEFEDEEDLGEPEVQEDADDSDVTDNSDDPEEDSEDTADPEDDIGDDVVDESDDSGDAVEDSEVDD
ncbi:MAG: hypothetical protein GT601_16985 [Acidaminobacter sp.]|uniref:anti-sigma-I factor RsgI family protein n=1 Tax=Acidaminobacter sp. TaxID=1872102 RepID=UPI00137E2BC8|nr:hypothetical protein [Acidaminobacter sp.]MZQ99363.1 hypothetical protein [Acidaminobacter sp.]